MPRAVVVFGADVMVSRSHGCTARLDHFALTPPVCMPCGSKTCQLVTSTVSLRQLWHQMPGTRSRVR